MGKRIAEQLRLTIESSKSLFEQHRECDDIANLKSVILRHDNDRATVEAINWKNYAESLGISLRLSSEDTQKVVGMQFALCDMWTSSSIAVCSNSYEHKFLKLFLLAEQSDLGRVFHFCYFSWTRERNCLEEGKQWHLLYENSNVIKAAVDYEVSPEALRVLGY